MLNKDVKNSLKVPDDYTPSLVYLFFNKCSIREKDNFMVNFSYFSNRTAHRYIKQAQIACTIIETCPAPSYTWISMRSIVRSKRSKIPNCAANRLPLVENQTNAAWSRHVRTPRAQWVCAAPCPCPAPCSFAETSSSFPGGISCMENIPTK
jgi:hypothetical protein